MVLDVINSVGDAFTNVKRLGSGAEGGTWSARDRQGREVVLKRVPRERRGDVARAFEVLREVSSPNLPAALELLPDGEGGCWLVTEYVEGGTLKPGPVELPRALSEALGVACALGSIHGLGTHHGDVSANNVIVTSEGSVVLTDLGQLGCFGCGTPGFLAPEVLSGGGGPAADRFSVGSLLCLRIFGCSPWVRPEMLLAVEGPEQVRARLASLVESSQITLPRPVEALLERLLDPDPTRRVAETSQLVARLRQLHRASSAGELRRTASAWWLPTRWGFVGERERIDGAVTALASKAVGLVAVVGPPGSGRGRVVEEIVAGLQLRRARVGEAESELAVLCAASAMERELGAESDPGVALAEDAELGATERSPDWGGDWISTWMNARRGRPARIWGLGESPPWPSSMADSDQVQAAVLRAGVGVEAPALIVPVDPGLGRALAAAAAAAEDDEPGTGAGAGILGPGAGILVLECSQWSQGEVEDCLAAVVEGAGAQATSRAPRVDDELSSWAAAIHEATGGWPAKVIRAIEACARQDRELPDRAAIEAALVSADSEPRLDPESARAVLDRRWGLGSEGEPLVSLVAAARVSLAGSVPVLARATAAEQRRRGRAVSLALALDADDASAVEDALVADALRAELGSDLLDWLEAGGALRVGPRLRLRALRRLIRQGQADRALELLAAIAATGQPSPAERLEGVRALEQLGRPGEALTAIDELMAAMQGPDRDRAQGLRWRALVDSGRAPEAVAEAERWAASASTGAPSWRRAVAWLWGGLAKIYAGGDAGPWLARALDECVGEHGPSTSRLVAGVRARVRQLEGNLAHLAGDGAAARRHYRAAAAGFARAGEGLGRVLVEGSLASLALEAGDYGEALLLGRRALRGFMARVQVQVLPAAMFNLARGLVAVGALGEARLLWGLCGDLCGAAGEVSALNRARLERVAIDLDGADCPARPELRRAWRLDLGERYSSCAAALVEAGVPGEAADAHLRAACFYRVDARLAPAVGGADVQGRSVRPAGPDARRALASARALAGELGASVELAVRVGLAVESLACADDLDALLAARRGLTQLPSPTELATLGQRQLAWIYDRALLGALHRLGCAGDSASASVTRRLFENLESFMANTSKLDRRTLRQSLLSEAGEAQPLRELARELEAAQVREEEGSGEASPELSELSELREPRGPQESRELSGPREPAPEFVPEREVRPSPARREAPPMSGGAAPMSQRGPRTEQTGTRLSRLLRVFRRLSREDQLERLLEQVVEAMMELTDAERGVVCVGEGEARIEVAREIAWGRGEGAAVDFSRSVIEQVLRAGEPVLSVDAASDDRFDGSRSISHLNLRSVLAVPLIFRGELLGAAYVDHRLRRGNFDAADLAHMEDFADLAALAVAQARGLAEVRAQAAVLETQRSELAELLASREVEVVNLREEVRSAPERREYRGMVGSSKAMQQVFRLIDRLASSEVPVVIYGESGTGKELVARAIHDAGARADKPFIAENCGAIPETLLESVLFGHARGAFTGAQGARPGLFEAANSGTIFLDEIGETSPAMQTKLLRVLQEGELRRLGENRARKIDVRVIAASNRDLEAMVAAGTFRQDLYYRINVVKLELPALRDRRGDIPALVEHFLSRHSARSHRTEVLEVTASAMRKLAAYPWPGNVRELENEVQRWLALCEDRVVTEDLSPAIEGSSVGVDDPDDLEIRPRVERMERELIARAMARTGGNQTQAAQLLGLSRYGLQKKLKRMEGTDDATT